MLGLFGNYLGLRDCTTATTFLIQQALCNIIEVLKANTPALEHITLDGNGFHLIKGNSLTKIIIYSYSLPSAHCGE